MSIQSEADTRAYSAAVRRDYARQVIDCAKAIPNVSPQEQKLLIRRAMSIIHPLGFVGVQGKGMERQRVDEKGGVEWVTPAEDRGRELGHITGVDESHMQFVSSRDHSMWRVRHEGVNSVTVEFNHNDPQPERMDELWT